MVTEDEDTADELMLRDLPGKAAMLVFGVATLALGWEVWGIVFMFGTFPRPLDRLDLGDIGGIAIFTTVWLAVLVGLLAVRRRRAASD